MLNSNMYDHPSLKFMPSRSSYDSKNLVERSTYESIVEAEPVKDEVALTHAVILLAL